MKGPEEVFLLDLEEKDVSISNSKGLRVVYVSVQDTEIVPKEVRTDGH